MATSPAVVLSEIQQDTLTRLCDTFVPSVEREDDPTGFWGRAASDLTIPTLIAEQLAAGGDEVMLAGVRALLDGLHTQGFDELDAPSRETMLLALMEADMDALAGLSALRGLTMLLFYGIPIPAPDGTVSNPNWAAVGYPGPRQAPPTPEQAPKTIGVLRPDGDELVLTADVVIVGSGAGGGVIAGQLAQAGKDVVVLEAGGYFNESDFNGLELWAYEHLYRGGGITQTAEGTIALLAGSCLGGGTTVNWTNCLRTRPAVREQWESEFGLEGLTGSDYDRHLDAVWERAGVNDSCSDFNGPTKRLQEACKQAGIAFKTITRNSDPSTYDADAAGLLGFGDATGSKQGTMKTWLQDASDAGARFVVGCRAETIVTEGGRAAGVQATATSEDGRTTRVVVRAPQVVCAAGALETPALLLRSGIGGPAVGDYLRLHPATGVSGIYAEPQQAWWGAPQTALSDEYADLDDGYGFLIETSLQAPALGSTATPWTSGEGHKELMAKGAENSAFVMLIRDRGHGKVTIDQAGNAVHSYAITDPVDDRHFRGGIAELIRLQELAGAEEIITYHRHETRWQRNGSESLEEFIRRAATSSIGPFDHGTFALHQMGSARMGNDPATSVAGPWGELHDTPGVWIGDASAFPTASGTNPMITVMALAHRTADAMRAAS
ncbi:MAG: FAD-dependent oxidoreductase [Solirubrobacteraceae bacterium]|nr:FAD-dependent oxidoreductase [Solirubrobacteraceae bacterium]